MPDARTRKYMYASSSGEELTFRMTLLGKETARVSIDKNGILQ